MQEALSKAPEERAVPRKAYSLIHKPRRGVLLKANRVEHKQVAPPELMRMGGVALGTGRPSGTFPHSNFTLFNTHHGQTIDTLTIINPFL